LDFLNPEYAAKTLKQGLNMSEKPRLKYEKPVSIDLGRVAPVLGDRCSVGNGASDCSVGFNNSSVPSCSVGGGASLLCMNGLGASGAACYSGSGFASGSGGSAALRRR
jgi:hypothetical protein